MGFDCFLVVLEFLVGCLGVVACVFFGLVFAAVGILFSMFGFFVG